MHYFRYYYGNTDRYDPRTKTWVPVNPDYLTRYILTGVAGLDTTTRRAVERELSIPLPGQERHPGHGHAPNRSRGALVHGVVVQAG